MNNEQSLRLYKIIQDCEFNKDNWHWKYNTKAGQPYFQILIEELDVDTGLMKLWHCRKWWLSPYMTESEIVQTVFLAVKVAMLHEVHEGFTYKRERVFDPHFDVNQLAELHKRPGWSDTRKEPDETT